MTRKALFLDRDGVINVDRGYVGAQENFEFVEGIFDLCAHATVLGYLVIVVTNQAGIGRGYYSEQEYQGLTEWMSGVFRDRGTLISHVYHCPYHPECGLGIYKMDSRDRKPAPGMILQAAVDFGLDLVRSVLVGDRETDIQAGVNAGVGCNLLYLPERSSVADTTTVATSIVSRIFDVLAFLNAQAAKAESLTQS